MSIPNQNIRTYTINKESPYYRELIPRPLFEGIWTKAKAMAVGYLCKLDPSHATLYQQQFPTINKYLEMDFFKESY